MKVICVCGVGCSGKSYHCRKLLTEYELDRKPRPILLQQGEFFRVAFGPDFFKELDNPTAPTVVEHWVRNMVYFAINIGHELDRDVILDGFPRTPNQFDWLMLSSPVSNRHPKVEIRFIWPAESVLESRIEERRIKNPEEADLIGVRLVKDASLLSNLHSVVDKAITQNTYHDGLIVEGIDA